MCVAGQGLQITDAVVARACVEDAAERESAKHGIAARAAATDRHALPVHPALRGQTARDVPAGVDVAKARMAQEPPPVLLSVSGGAAVVYVHHGVVSGGAVLR